MAKMKTKKITKQDASNINSYRLFVMLKEQDKPNWLMYFNAILAGQESLVYLAIMKNYFDGLPLSSLYCSYSSQIEAKALKLQKQQDIK